MAGRVPWSQGAPHTPWRCEYQLRGVYARVGVSLFPSLIQKR